MGLLIAPPSGINEDSAEAQISEAKSELSGFEDLISFPSNIGPHSMLMIFRDYSYEVAKSGAGNLLSIDSSSIRDLFSSGGSRDYESYYDNFTSSTSSISGIELPLPANLTDSTNLNIQNITQSAFDVAAGEVISQGISNLESSNQENLGDLIKGIRPALDNIGGEIEKYISSGNISEDISDTLKNIFDKVLSSKPKNASRDLAYILRSFGKIQPGTSNAIDRALGSTVNPKASLAFEGVQLKSHSFNWTLAPKSSGESDTLNALIKTLKKKSLPSYENLSETSFKAYLKYPSIVQIYLVGVDPDYFVRFKPGLVTSVGVDYSSVGGGLVSILKGGKPAAVSLSISVSELDIHVAEDYA